MKGRGADFLLISLLVGTSSSASEVFAPPDTSDSDDETKGTDDVMLQIAGILDLTTFDWAEDLINFTVDLINNGEWDLLPKGMKLKMFLENSNCDEATAMEAYWRLRTLNGDKPMEALLGARCSGITEFLAHIAGTEHVPQITPNQQSSKPF